MHDDQTEVLTQQGWKLFSQVTKADALATVDPKTAILTYKKPKRLVRSLYNGTLIHGSHQNVNFLVTPEHTMIVRRWNQRNTTLFRDYVSQAAKNLGWYVGLLTRIKWHGSKSASNTYALTGINTKRKAQRQDLSLSMAAWLRFLGLYLAEGTLAPKTYKEHRIQIAASKKREQTFVATVLREIGIRNSYNSSDRFTFTNHRLYNAIASLGLYGIHAPQKFVPTFVFEQSAAHLSELLLGHFAGDGSDNGTGFRRHYTSSKQLADDLQRLVFLSGNESFIYARQPRSSTMKDGRKVVGKHPEYCVSVCERRASSLQRKKHVTEKQYKGKVFGAKFPVQRALVTRREGCILISGAS